METYQTTPTFRICSASMPAAGVVLEHVEDAIKVVITEDDMLPEGCKTLPQDEWGVELADYFECVAGNIGFCSSLPSSSGMSAESQGITNNAHVVW